MGDPRQTFHLPVEGEPPIRFTNTAIARADRSLGKVTPQWTAEIFAGVFGFDTLNRVTLAGLEGARLKNRTGGREWKLADVEELIEDAYDNGVTFDELAGVVVDALTASLKRPFPPDREPDSEDPPKAAGTGTSRSEPPSDQE